MQVNFLKLGDNVHFMRTLPSASVELTVTSPPYDDVAAMGGMFNFDEVASELWRLTKPRGVVVWIVGDERVNNCKSGTTHYQAVRFRDIGFALHDSMPMIRSHTRMPSNHCHANIYETALILSKGVPKTINVLRDVPNRNVGRAFRTQRGRHVAHWQVKEFGRRMNCWYYAVGGVHTSADECTLIHPCRMPEQMAADHIETWSKPEDIVLDPFSGVATTAKMALLANRNFIGVEIDEEYHVAGCHRLKLALRSKFAQKEPVSEDIQAAAISY
jgi:hypothetical protein